MTVRLAPIFNDQTFDASGNPAVGYQLFTYVAGSSTKLTTYTDSAGSTPQTNPIILNASGYPTNGPIWLTSGQAYKFVLALPTDTDPPSSPVKTIDNISGINDTNSTVSQWASSGLTPTYVSATSFTVTGDQTTELHVGRRVQATTSGGTVYGTIYTSAYAALTTVTLTMDSGQVLDSGLSVINLSLLRNDHLALPSSANVSTLATPVATISGATINFSGIPPTAKKIQVMLNGVSTTGSSAVMLQLGDSGGIEAAGYLGEVSDIVGVSASAFSTGFLTQTAGNTAHLRYGIITLSLINSSTNLWACSFVIGNTVGTVYVGGGTKSTSAVLDRVTLTTVGGTDTFDGGSMNILYE